MTAPGPPVTHLAALLALAVLPCARVVASPAPARSGPGQAYRTDGGQMAPSWWPGLPRSHEPAALIGQRLARPGELWGRPSGPHLQAASGDDDSDQDLRHWMASVKVHIPGVSKKVASLNVTLDHGICDKLMVRRIVSTPPAFPELVVDLNGLQIRCSLRWHAKGMVLDTSGGVVAELANSTLKAGIKTRESTENPRLPVQLSIDACKADLQIQQLTFSGGTTSAIIGLLSNFIKSELRPQLMETLCDGLKTAIAKQSSGVLRTMDKVIINFLQTERISPQSPDPLPEPTTNFAEFDGNPGVVLLGHLVNDVLGNFSSPYSVNTLATMLMGPRGQISADALGLLPFSHAMEVAGVGAVNVSVTAASLRGLNTWSKLALPRPVSRQMGLVLALDALLVSLSLRVQVTPSNGTLTGQPITENLNVRAGLKNFTASPSIYLGIDNALFRSMTFDQLTQFGCIADVIYQVLMMQAPINTSSLEWEFVFTSRGKLERDVAALSALLTNGLLAEFQEAVRAVFKHLVSVKLPDLVNQELAQTLTFAQTCPGPKEDYTMPHTTLVTRVVAAAFLCLAALHIAKRAIREKLHTPAPAGVPDADGSFHLPAPSPEGGQRWAAEANEEPASVLGEWDSLAFHPRTGLNLRVGLPLLIGANLAFLTLANSGICISVLISLTAGGQEVVHLPAFKEYSPLGTVLATLHARVFALFLLLVLFSGAWPYVKMVALLFCWFAPTRILSVQSRQHVLDLLQACGKWCFVEAFVMLLFVAILRMSLSATDNPLQILEDIFGYLGGAAEGVVRCQPSLEFYFYLLASLFSQLLGHAVASCHLDAVPAKAPYSAERLRLCDAGRCPGSRGRLLVWGPLVALMLAELLMLVGFVQDAFAVTFEGLVGLLYGEARRLQAFSVISLARGLPYFTLEPNFNLRCFQIVFILCVVVAPVAYPIVLSILWCAPLSGKTQQRLLVTVQVLSTWNSLDVFMVTLFVTVGAVPLFTLDCMGSLFDSVNLLLPSIPFFRDRVPGRAMVVDMKTEIRSGCRLLIIAAVLLNVTGRLVIRKCNSALHNTGGRNSAVELIVNGQ